MTVAFGAARQAVSSYGAALGAIERREAVRQVARHSLRRRRRVARAMAVLSAGALVLALVPLVAIVGYTARRGIGAWSVAFFTHMPTPAGIPGGGILNAIVGSLIIDGIAAGVGIPFALACAVWLADAESRTASRVRFAADVLAGIPSLIIGIFAYTVVVATTGTFSGAAASFALAVIIVPLVMRASEQAIRGVPRDVPAAALALGARRSAVLMRVVLPAAMPGILTAALLGTAQAAAETAPLLFTTIGSQYLVTSPLHPMNSLPLLVYLDGIQAYPDLQQTAWGAALVLLLLVLLLNVGARFAVALLLGRRGTVDPSPRAYLGRPNVSVRSVRNRPRPPVRPGPA
ncbi:MAG: pstA [Acidimicrobiaceae bacterium]|nr:pstA [Acidimicrobiaceae bacterium]